MRSTRWHPDGAGRSKLAAALGARSLGVTATARNWATVGKLLALADDVTERRSGARRELRLGDGAPHELVVRGVEPAADDLLDLSKPSAQNSTGW